MAGGIGSAGRLEQLGPWHGDGGIPRHSATVGPCPSSGGWSPIRTYSPHDAAARPGENATAAARPRARPIARRAGVRAGVNMTTASRATG